MDMVDVDADSLYRQTHSLSHLATWRSSTFIK